MAAANRRAGDGGWLARGTRRPPQHSLERGATHYRRFCPNSRALDVIGERGTLPIVMDPLHDGTRLNDLARGLLSRRLTLRTAHQLDRVLQERDRPYQVEHGVVG